MAEDVDDLLPDGVLTLLGRFLQFLRSLDAGLDAGKEDAHIEGLGDVVLHTHRDALDDILFFGLGSEEDEGDIHPLVPLPYLAVEVVAVHLRHHDVGDDDGRCCFLHPGQRFVAVGRGERFVAGIRQQFCQPLENGYVVLDDENDFSAFIHQ